MLTSPEPAHPKDGFGDRIEQFHLYRLGHLFKKTDVLGNPTSAHSLCLGNGSDGLSGCIVVLSCSIGLIHYRSLVLLQLAIPTSRSSMTYSCRRLLARRFR